MKRFAWYLAFILILFSGKNSFTQPIETNIWYFGKNAGLDFSSGSPVAISGGQINSLEGCTVISDRNTGQVLFYSDGISVWNRNHQVMPNGTGLWGHPSSSQSGIVIPNPANGNQYYLFTIPAQAGYVNGISTAAYSIVDMTLDGGLGNVSIKNQSLVGPVAEKITAVRHCNGTDFWVVIHKWNSNEFYSYLVSSSGISAPIISASGDSIKNVGSPLNAETIGYLKFSPHGNRLSMGSFAPLNKAQMFDFDGATGIVSNPVSLNIPPTPVPVPPANDPYGGPYGISFSPDGTRLYLAWHNYVGIPNYVFQYDVTLGTEAAIQASRTTVAMTSASSFGALQLATDGKIYVANLWYSTSNVNAPTGSTTLGRIENPNLLGIACGWNLSAATLASNTYGFWGLPNFIESYFSNDALSLGPDLYLSPPFSVTLDAGAGFTSYLWSDGSTTQTINASANGTYWVTVTNQNGCVQTDTLHILLPLSIQQVEPIQEFNLSYTEPNSILVSFRAIEKQNFSVRIFSTDGKLLFQKLYPGYYGLFKNEYSLNFPKGVYLLNVASESSSKNVKLTVT